MPRKGSHSGKDEQKKAGAEETEHNDSISAKIQSYEKACHRFYKLAGSHNLITSADDSRLPGQGPDEPDRVRIALDQIIDLYRRETILTDRDEIKDLVSRRKANPETGSQDLFDKLLSHSILVPVRRVAGGNDDTYLIHGDVVRWFQRVLHQGADIETDSARLEAIMRFLTSEAVLDSNKTPREIAQSAWLFGRMTADVETDALDSRITHEGKLKANESPDEGFLLHDRYVPESNWGNLYNQYILQGWLSDSVQPASKHMYKEDLEQHLSTLLTTALYETGAFQDIRNELESEERSGTEKKDNSTDTPTSLEDTSLAEYRRALAGLNENSDLSELSKKLPTKALEFDTAMEASQTRTAAYYAIRSNEVSR